MLSHVKCVVPVSMAILMAPAVRGLPARWRGIAFDPSFTIVTACFHGVPVAALLTSVLLGAGQKLWRAFPRASRRYSPLRFRFGLAALCAAFAGIAQAQNVTFTALDLGTGIPNAINDAGQVAGSQSEPLVSGDAFLYSGGKMIGLGTLPGGTMSAAYGINKSGQVVGSSSFASSLGEVHAFLYSGANMVDLGVLPNGLNSTAYAINSAGQVVGQTGNHAFLYSGGLMTDLGVLGNYPTGYEASQASSINNQGQAVGWSTSASGHIHAFVYAGGTMMDLGTLPGGTQSQASAINNNGQIVGWSDTGGGDIHAFLYSNGSMVDIAPVMSGGTSEFFPQSSWGIGVSDLGQVVGNSANATGAPFLYSGGVLSFLTDIVNLPSELYINRAQAINSLGQIAAGASDGHAYLLTRLSLWITTFTLPNAISGQPYHTALNAAAGSGTGYTWSVSSGSLPAGFTLSTGGVLASTGSPPSAPGTYTFNAMVTDSAGNSAVQSLRLVVQLGVELQIATTVLPNATSGQPYSATLTATGGSGAGYVWSVFSGSLPDGFAFSSGGVLTTAGSSPALPKTYAFTVKVADSTGNNATQALTLAVQLGLELQITTSTLPDATSGQPYHWLLGATGGSGIGYVWSLSSGSLPAGFALTTAGVLGTTGTPPANTQTYGFTVAVTDSFGDTANHTLTLAVQAPKTVSADFLTDLHDFGSPILTSNGTSGLDGSYPQAGVTFDAAGNLYGTGNGGGAYAAYGNYDHNWATDVYSGMVWELTPSGTYKDLHDFAGGGPANDWGITGPPVVNADGTEGPDGWGPNAGITFDSAGNMYGTTTYGGPEGRPGSGIVWEISASGVYKDLHDFGSALDGANPYSSVTFDTRGNLYGTTSGGGANKAGMVWGITESGVYQDLHDFAGTVTNAAGKNVADGATPYEGVTFDSAGNMFGTTQKGGLNNLGVVWEITASGLYKDIHDFGGTLTNNNGASSPDGANPTVRVTFDSSGNMYGTASGGGPYGGGVVWVIAVSGTYRDLHDFGGTVTNANGESGPDGMTPYRAGVTLDSAGNLYGTTLGAGGYGGGMVWEITASGTYKDLYDFYSPGGFWPGAGVTLDDAENVYGTTGGYYSADAPVCMMLWKLAPAVTSLQAPSIAPGGIVAAGSGSSLSGTLTQGEWISIYGSNLAASTMSWSGNFATNLGGTSVTIFGVAAFPSFVSPGQINLQVPTDITTTSTCCAGSASGPVPLVVNTPGGEATATVTLTQYASPSLLLLDGKHVAGIILRSDGSGFYGGGTYDIIGPGENALGYPTVPAKPGDTIEIFAVGLGQSTAGEAWAASAVNHGVNLFINDVTVVNYSSAVLAGSGLFQINLEVPAGLGTGDIPIATSVGMVGLGDVASAPGAVISLQ